MYEKNVDDQLKVFEHRSVSLIIGFGFNFEYNYMREDRTPMKILTFSRVDFLGSAALAGNELLTKSGDEIFVRVSITSGDALLPKMSLTVSACSGFKPIPASR